MQESLSLITTIIALGAIQSTIIFAFVFWGIGFRGAIGAVLALIFGVGVALSNAPASSVSWDIDEFKIINAAEINSRLEQRSDVQYKEQIKNPIMAAAFSDLKNGLSGVVFLIPFLLIDIIAIVIFKVLEVGWYQVSWLTLPIKVLLFLSVDGVSLVASRLF